MRRWNYLIEAELTDIPGVKRIIDTANPARGDIDSLRNVGVLRNKRIVTWHVSDDVTGLKEAISKGVSLMKAGGKSGDLGAGLYTSAIPHIWASRSSDKWAFLDKLSKQQLNTVVDKLESEIQHAPLSESEKRTAVRDLGYIKTDTISRSALARFASLPYGIRIWKPQWLAPLGIKNDMEPMMVEVHLTGKFAELTKSAPPPRALRRAGLAGAFTPQGFSSTAQLVIWSPKAITFVGNPERVS